MRQWWWTMLPAVWRLGRSRCVWRCRQNEKGVRGMIGRDWRQQSPWFHALTVFHKGVVHRTLCGSDVSRLQSSTRFGFGYITVLMLGSIRYWLQMGRVVMLFWFHLCFYPFDFLMRLCFDLVFGLVLTGNCFDFRFRRILIFNLVVLSFYKILFWIEFFLYKIPFWICRMGF